MNNMINDIIYKRFNNIIKKKNISNDKSSKNINLNTKLNTNLNDILKKHKNTINNKFIINNTLSDELL